MFLKNFTDLCLYLYLNISYVASPIEKSKIKRLNLGGKRNRNSHKCTRSRAIYDL